MIKVIFFAAIREQLDCSELSIAPAGIATIADLKQQLAHKGDTWAQVFTSGSLLTAQNQSMVDDETVINSGDEIAFFPPVTGG